MVECSQWEVFMQLNSRQETLHQAAVQLFGQHKKIESRLVEVLVEIDQEKIYKKFKRRSLFEYCVSLLGMTEAQAYAFITVARKSNEVPELKNSLRVGQLTVSKASRFVAILSSENAGELLEFAQTHSSREIDSEVKKRKSSTQAFHTYINSLPRQEFGKSLKSLGV